MSDRFQGFGPRLVSFYEGLDADNSKRYWEANRHVYEEDVREPLELLAAELAPEFGVPKVFRPYRDVRFSKEKTPYKLAAAALLRRDDEPRSYRYLQVSADGLLVGVGLYDPDRDQLGAIREAIADDRRGPELERIVAELAKAKLSLHGAELRTAPRGYPRDHERIELLRRKRIAAMRSFPAAKWLQKREALTRVADAWRAGQPLNAWLERNAVPRAG